MQNTNNNAALIEAQRALAEAHALGHTHKYATLKALIRALKRNGNGGR